MSPLLARELAKDVRTIVPYLQRRLLPARPPPARPWSTRVHDAERGTVTLTGDLRQSPQSRAIVVLVHGLGGSPRSTACLRGAALLSAEGISTLCLSLRGSDRRGEDFYNVAQGGDLEAALASPELARYERAYVIGYSMGGYAALHLAHRHRPTASDHPQLAGVAALCTPLELGAAQRYIDSPRARLYRWNVLRGLIGIYTEVAKRHEVPTDPERVKRVRTMHEWDRLTIAPRYGYDSPEHYYRELSIVPHLNDLAVPALLLAAEADPIIPPQTIAPFLGDLSHSRRPLAESRTAPAECPKSLTVQWVPQAGHLVFPREHELGLGPPAPLELQILHWMRGAR